MKQLRIGVLALGAATVVVLAAAPVTMAGADKRVEIVRRIGGRAYLGVTLEDTSGAERGARVKQVVKGSPAEKAGIKDGDVIARFDGENVRGASQLARLVSETPEGRAVAVEVRRGGATQKLEATLAAGRPAPLLEFGDDLAFIPESPDLPEAPRAPRAPRAPAMPRFDFRWHQDDLPGMMLGGGGGPRKLGIQYQAIEGQLAKYFKLSGDEGILVTSVEEGGPAGKAGLRAGDVILQLGGKAIEDSRDLRKALDAGEPGSEVAVQVLREGRPVDLKVTLGGQREKREKREKDEGEET